MLTVKEAAKAMHVTTETIRQYIRDGRGEEEFKLRAEIVYHGMRREYRITHEDLDAFKKKYITP